MNDLKRIAKGGGTGFENWFFIVLFLVVSATWVWAADYADVRMIDGQAYLYQEGSWWSLATDATADYLMRVEGVEL